MERSNRIRSVVAVFIVATSFGAVVRAQYDGGNGTPGNPYLIHTAEDLCRLSTEPNDWGMFFKLMADLDLKEYTGRLGIIGTQDRPFTGGFNGNGHQILNLSRTAIDGNNVGLFGYLDDQQAQGGIKYLDLVDPNIQAENSEQVGALVGWLCHGGVTGCRVIGGSVTGGANTGGLVGRTGSRDVQDRPTSKASMVGCTAATTVHGQNAAGGLLGHHCVGVVWGCSSEGETSGSDEVGGLIGRSNDTITDGRSSGHTTGHTDVGGLAGYSAGSVVNCHAQGEVFGSNQYVGGLLGSNHAGTISDSYCLGKVRGVLEVGGLIGFHDGTIVRCWTSNEVTGDTQVGGLVGSHNEGAIAACYTTGTVIGKTTVGGLVGCNWRTINQCYSTAQVTGVTMAGGLVGQNWRIIQYCYSTGQVTGEATPGGLVGENSGTITQCYAAGPVYADQPAGGLVGTENQQGRVELSFWDTQASGQATSAAGTGKTTVQMQTASTFAAWAPSNIWTMEEGRDYPRLAWQKTPGGLLSLPTYGGGSGTESDPYVISAPEHLVALSVSPSQWNKHFKLSGSIDLTAWPEAMEPIGNETTYFSGTFDGSGHSILGYSCTSTTGRYIGLFGHVEHDAKISNLRLIGPRVNAAQAYAVGALAGLLGTGAEIQDCHAVDADLSGDSGVGGLVGNNSGTIDACSTTGVAKGQRTIGGLAGDNQGLIAGCFSRTDVIASDATIAVVGGLVGQNQAAIRDSYAVGNVVGSRRLGGLVGTNYGSVRDCYSTGLVTGTTEVGGLVGSQTAGDVYASFWDVETSGCRTSIGGVGKTTAELQRMDTFVGWVEAGIWTLAQGQDYPRLAWENAPGEPLLGPQPLGSFAGEGTAESPYLIGTAEELNKISSCPSEWNKHFKLTADLDLSGFTGEAFTLIGNATMPFSGTFDGDGHTISNFSHTSEQREYVGLFVVVDGESACIRNLTLVKPSVKSFAYVAALVGELRRGRIVNCGVENATVWAEHCVAALVSDNKGEVSQCYVRGNVTTQYEDAGGLAGRNYGTITQSFSTANCQALGWTKGSKHIEGSGVGSLVGYNEGAIRDCYAMGSASAELCAGGLVGYNSTKSITNCYSTGMVSGTSRIGGLVGGNGGTVKNCFWNVNTSHRSTSAGGSGQSTSAMKQMSLYLAAGWDFDGETANGTEEIWTIEEAQDYPRLAWESAVADDAGK